MLPKDIEVEEALAPLYHLYFRRGYAYSVDPPPCALPHDAKQPAQGRADTYCQRCIVWWETYLSERGNCL